MKINSNYRVELRKVVENLLSDLKENQDIQITTKEELVVNYLVDGIVKSDFPNYVRSNPHKAFGADWAQG